MKLFFVLTAILLSSTSQAGSFRCQSLPNAQMRATITTVMNEGNYRARSVVASYRRQNVVISQAFDCRHTAYEILCSPKDPASLISSIEIGQNGTVFTTRSGRGIENFTDCDPL